MNATMALERPVGRVRGLLSSPLATYHLLVGSTTLLLALGLVMVLSASSVESYKVFGSSFVLAQRQFMFAGFGVLLMLLISRVPIASIRRLAWPLLGATLVLLVLVLVIALALAS